MVLVGEHGTGHACAAQGVEKVENAGVGSRVVLLVLGVEGAEVGERLLKNAAVPHEFGGNKALDELELPVADFVAELVRRVGGPSSGFAYMVAGDGEVLKGVEQCAVKVEYHVGVGHGAPFPSILGNRAYDSARTSG